MSNAEVKSQTMLYKHPGRHDIHGSKFDYIIVDDDKIEDALADGWHLTTDAAKEAHAAAEAEKAAQAKIEAEARALEEARRLVAENDGGNAPPTRAELEQKATDLGIKFDGRTGDKKLAEAIADALKG